MARRRSSNFLNREKAITEDWLALANQASSRPGIILRTFTA